jgi:hypothetical protein
MSSLSYLGSELAPICMVFAGSLALICTALATLFILKMLDVIIMAGLSDAIGIWRLSSLNSAMTTALVASSMLSCSQSGAHYILASTVMTPVGIGILSLR